MLWGQLYVSVWVGWRVAWCEFLEAHFGGEDGVGVLVQL